MFVLKSSHEKLQVEYLHTVARYKSLLKEWNALVKRINELGGEDFLRRKATKQPQQLSAEDIQRLIQLCHPDKHDGKPMATEMTAKLLKMKEQA